MKQFRSSRNVRKGSIDPMFARTLLILVGALLIFSFWLMAEKDKPFPTSADDPTVTNIDTGEVDTTFDEADIAELEAPDSAPTASPLEAADPVLGELTDEGLLEENFDGLDGLEDIVGEGDVDDLTL